MRGEICGLNEYLRCKINLQGWPFQDAWFSSPRLQQPRGFSSPRTAAGGPAKSPAPPRRPDAEMEAADVELSSGILSSHCSYRTVPHTQKTASIGTTFWSLGQVIEIFHCGDGPTRTICQTTTTQEGAPLPAWRVRSINIQIAVGRSGGPLAAKCLYSITWLCLTFGDQ